MTNEKIYKMELMEVLDFVREEAMQHSKHHFLKRIHAIFNLIDRQPSEEEAKRAWFVVDENLFSRYPILVGDSTSTFSEAYKTIRKALNIEEG